MDAILPADPGLLVSERERGLFLLAGGRATPFAPEASRWTVDKKLYDSMRLPDGRWALTANSTSDSAALVDLAVRAEASGWDGVFLWDHLVSGALPIADTWTTLGAIAQATRDLRFGRAAKVEWRVVAGLLGGVVLVASATDCWYLSK